MVLKTISMSGQQKISLRPQFINQLGLPFVLKYSHITKMLINVPWTSLKQKPTTITIQGIYVLLALKYDDLQQNPINPKQRFDEIFSRVKQELKKKIEQKQTNKSQTFAQKSIIRIIDNLIVNIDEIHVRVESMKRDWDFSFGVILDRISSFTVNQYGQKNFYTRHFTNKELNPPLKKSFACERFQIYFNDRETFFMCEKQDKNKGQLIKNLLAQPFSSKSTSPIKKKQSSPQKIIPQVKPSYQMKNLTRFSFDIIAQQKLSADKKYIVQVKGQLPKVSFLITDIQLSQILVITQLIYEWVLDKEKNGRRVDTFSEKSQAEFKKILLKKYKDQKLTQQDLKNLFTIITQTSLDKLQNAADNLIKDYRIEKQMKKIISKNKQNSKQMIQKLLDRIQNQDKQVLQLFQHFIIQLNIPQFKLSCLKSDQVLFQLGFSSIQSDTKLVLLKHTLATIKISQPFITNYPALSTPKTLILAESPRQQPFMQFSITKFHKSPPNIKFSLLKRHILLDEDTLLNLVIWISCIRLKPPLINFIAQQMNYSIHIMQEIFKMLFSSRQLALQIVMEVPVIGIQIGNGVLEIDYGTIGIRREDEDRYVIQVMTKQEVRVNGKVVVGFGEGTCVELVNAKPEAVGIQVKNMVVSNLHEVFKFLSSVMKKPIVDKFRKLQLIMEEEIIFQGKFQLNQYVTLQNMLLKGNYLHFFPSNQKIYLLRTKMYPFLKNGKYGLIFRQQVQKQINIVLMSSQKLMSTLFQTIKQHMLYISTLSQYTRYLKSFPETLITSISQLQTKQQNKNLMDLTVSIDKATFQLGQTKYGETVIQMQDMRSVINYKEYNTDAKGEIGEMGIRLGDKRMIENLAVFVGYSYVDYMAFVLRVSMLRLKIDDYQIVQQIINLTTQYMIMTDSLLKSLKAPTSQPPLQSLNIKHTHQQISYLLQSQFLLQLHNIQSSIIGFHNSLKNSTLSISSYRNSPPTLKLKIDKFVLMSCVTVMRCQVEYNGFGRAVRIGVEDVGVYLSTQLVYYELTTGRGRFFVGEVLDLVERRGEKIRENLRKLQEEEREKGDNGTIDNTNMIDNKQKQVPIPKIEATIRGFKARLRLTQNQQLLMNLSNADAVIAKDQQKKIQSQTSIQEQKMKQQNQDHAITTNNLIDARLKWHKLAFIINNNVVLEPISGKLSLKATKSGVVQKINAQIQPIVVNIAVNKLIESAIVIKISLQRIFSLEIVRQMLSQKLKATNPRLQSLHSIHSPSIPSKSKPKSSSSPSSRHPHLTLSLQTVSILLFSLSDHPLLRLSISPLILDTSSPQPTAIQLTLEHLNSLLRIYEPILQPMEIKMQIKDGPQMDVQVNEIRINVSEELVRDGVKEVVGVKEGLNRLMKEVKVNFGDGQQNQLQKYKNIISSMIIPQAQQQQQQSQAPESQPRKSSPSSPAQTPNPCNLILSNSLQTPLLLQLTINQKKSQFHLQAPPSFQSSSCLTFNEKSQYRQSYQMIEKYKEILVKVSIIHDRVSVKSVYFRVFLDFCGYVYDAVCFWERDAQGNNGKDKEMWSAVGLKVWHEQKQIGTDYHIDVVAPYKVVNMSKIDLNLNWINAGESFKKELKYGENQWISPWVKDRVTINPNNQHLFASSFQIDFQKNHNLYQINLNSSVNTQVVNYCCLTIQRQTVKIQKSLLAIKNPSSLKSPSASQALTPSIFTIKPTYFLINHFHMPIFINDIECPHKQKIPLYSMFRSKGQTFIRLRFGDGSMHQLYLPKPNTTSTLQLQLSNKNFIQICLHRQKSQQDTDLATRNECIYHLYSKLELIISLPKNQQLTLVTNILSTRYVLKKQVEINGNENGGQIFEFEHPKIVDGDDKSQGLVRDRFVFYSYVYVLDQYEKYLQIKTNTMYTKQITLYPSYFGNEIQFHKLPQSSPSPPPSSSPSQSPQPHKSFSISYQFTKITPQTTMFYVTIQPRFYILNQTLHNFNIDGQGLLKFNERIVIDVDKVEMIYIDGKSQIKWDIVGMSSLVDFGARGDVMFFREVLFREYQINQMMKKKRVRKLSKSIQQNLLPQKQKSLTQSQRLDMPIQPQKQVLTISSQNIKIFQIIKHTGNYSATTFCLHDWNQWLNIHNNLDRCIVIATTYNPNLNANDRRKEQKKEEKKEDKGDKKDAEAQFVISIQTLILPGEVGNHPYGVEGMERIQVYIIDSKDQDKNKPKGSGFGERLELGVYENNQRFNDQIQVQIPGQNGEQPRSQTIIMYQMRSRQGRKIVFSPLSLSPMSPLSSSSSSSQIRSLLFPTFLRISQSLKLSIPNLHMSLITGRNALRRQLLNFHVSNLDLLLLLYPSGLYMLHCGAGLAVHAPGFVEPVLLVDEARFYLEAVQGKFMERVTLQLGEVGVFLTDKLITDVMNIAQENIKNITKQQQIFQTSIPKPEPQGFYTSSLNSVLIHPITLTVTIKKLLPSSPTLLHSSLTIIQLQQSRITLPKIDIDQPITSSHLQSITKQYVMQIIVGCLGGLNLIGNPKQFMEEIEAGRVRGKPVIGVVGGVLAGTANGVGKILASVSNGVSSFSMDQEYRRERNMMYMEQGRGFANGVKSGSKTLFSSIKSGVVGLYTKPKEGLKEQGGLGLLKGAFSGLTGLIVKPVTGIMDAASMTVQGLKSASSYTAQDSNKPQNLEKPLYHKFKIIRCYDYSDHVLYNSLARILRTEKSPQSPEQQPPAIDLVQAFILEDQNRQKTQQGVLITAQKLYRIDYIDDKIIEQISNKSMGATGYFNEGVVLYPVQQNENENQSMRQSQHEERIHREDIVFRITDPKKKMHLYHTLKGFIGLYAQSKDREAIPEE